MSSQSIFWTFGTLHVPRLSPEVFNPKINASSPESLCVHRTSLWHREAARPLLSFAGVLFLATLPWNATLAVLFTSYLHEVKAAVSNRPGVIAYEDTPLPTKPWLLQGEAWSLPITSAILRKSSADGVIAPPRGFAGFLPYAASDLPNLGRFQWRE